MALWTLLRKSRKVKKMPSKWNYGGLTDDLYELVDKATSDMQEQTDEFIMIEVDSSNVAEIGYSEEREILRVLFHNGGLYEYYNVPSMEFGGLRSAPSTGKYLAKNIKGTYKFKKVGGSTKKKRSKWSYG